MVDAIVSNVIDKLTTIIWDEIKQEVQLVLGVEEDVEKLKFALIEIQDVLDDAEKKQFMKRSVKLWLQKLQDVAYDIDDVLDEWNTAILKSQLEQQRSRVDDDARRTNSSSASKKGFEVQDAREFNAAYLMLTVLRWFYFFEHLGAKAQLLNHFVQLQDELEDNSFENNHLFSLCPGELMQHERTCKSNDPGEPKCWRGLDARRQGDSKKAPRQSTHTDA